ncbi:hypothetical protein G647_07333 [Cladophialophora carrionii CBS 160.54]|uniref:Heterokaryon incompatibility domain-containing protein n=1 Tax=Cladophialophora carrionii CBS 160.54 TaxID=1279043 RepID=V9D290_9EURO|nr:uncharacterized protein G647_07333 [Cladophialophora carrionii CBS 160.54]ETI20990.1 hypothetical protein G647_07333 [Cladophialophora carrionii CBS 160.54]
MASIFQTAVDVVAWLENHDIWLEGVNSGRRRSISDAFWLSSPTYPTDLEASLDILEAFFDHEYWHRRWIIQELAFARSAQICCGGFTVPFTHVRKLVHKYTSWVKESRQSRRRLESNSVENSLAARILDLHQSPRGPDLTLEQLIYNYASAECAEPLDKVYALVSMSRLASESFPVSYDVSKLELLLTTVEFSFARQSLHPTKAIPFALALSEQIGIKVDELVPTTQAYSMRSDTVGDNCQVISMLCRRGIVTASRVDEGPLFYHKQALRERCQELTHFDVPTPITRVIQPSQEVASAHDASFSAGTTADLDNICTPYNQWRVSPRDLFAFTWQRTRPEHQDSSLDGVHLGFATTRTEAGDVLYQFPGTSVAILLRKSRRELRL